MTLKQLLEEHAEEIISEADEAVSRARLKHYQKAGKETTRERLQLLFSLTARSIRDRNLAPIIAHAERVAGERFSSGFDLWEVQTAFNVLEEALWKRVLREIPPPDLAEALGMVSTVLGVGKDSLACAYVTLASKSRAPSMNLQSMFTTTPE